MEASSWSSGRAIFLSIDCLVTVAVFQFFMDIRWQWHLTQAFQNLKEDTVVAKFYDTATVIQFLSNSCGQASITKTDFSTYFKAFGWLGQNFPLIALGIFQKEKFHMAVGIRLFTIETGRKYARIVHDQGIARVKLVDDVVEVGISHFLGYRINDQEFRGVTLFQWSLGNQFLW